MIACNYCKKCAHCNDPKNMLKCSYCGGPVEWDPDDHFKGGGELVCLGCVRNHPLKIIEICRKNAQLNLHRSIDPERHGWIRAESGDHGFEARVRALENYCDLIHRHIDGWHYMIWARLKIMGKSMMEADMTGEEKAYWRINEAIKVFEGEAKKYLQDTDHFAYQSVGVDVIISFELRECRNGEGIF